MFLFLLVIFAKEFSIIAVSVVVVSAVNILVKDFSIIAVSVALVSTDDYVAYVLDQYDNAASDDERLGVIIGEYHLASWGSGLEAYNAYRRTGHPNEFQPARDADPLAYIRSMDYPSVYVDRNANASQKANLTVQVFWDTFTGTLY